MRHYVQKNEQQQKQFLSLKKVVIRSSIYSVRLEQNRFELRTQAKQLGPHSPTVLYKSIICFCMNKKGISTMKFRIYTTYMPVFLPMCSTCPAYIYIYTHVRYGRRDLLCTSNTSCLHTSQCTKMDE